MIFTTYKFVLLFLPTVVVVYYVLNHFKWFSLSKFWLIIASFFFYSQGTPDFFPFFMGSVFANYMVGITLSRMDPSHKVQRKILCALGILGNVALLGYYKYTDFFIENTNAIFGTDFTLKHIILPIGISFFTFQLIAYVVDSYKQLTKDYNILDYLLFITFFPQLIVGPIVHHSEMVCQFENEDNLRLKPENIAFGLFLFSIGAAKKMFLADTMSTDAQLYFDDIRNNMPLMSSWYYSLEYAVAYYFDLSGYADMAIGMGWMFNIKIPENFNSPLKARDFQDYWKRWHMTLSRFLGDYIFRSVFRKGVKYRNYYVATMVTFFVSGFWHGSGWNFVIWGIINGALVCLASWMNRKGIKIPVVIGVFFTLCFVAMTRALFVADSLSEAWLVIKNMFNFSWLYGDKTASVFSQIVSFFRDHEANGPILFFSLLWCWFLPNSTQIAEKFRRTRFSVVLTVVLLGACLLNMDKVVQFLYFQF
ncbi:MAG: MBOAT family protein [Lachnospiraceae bacterium]|nr:MBOAT family protein [Lachnospiraceae bacterium]